MDDNTNNNGAENNANSANNINPDTSANNNADTNTVNNPTTTPDDATNQNTPTPDTVSDDPMAVPTAQTPAPAPVQHKSNSKLIAIIAAAIIVVLVAVIVTLVVVLVNNSSKSQTSNKGGSHYEESDNGKTDKEDKDDTITIVDANISCMGYNFKMLDDYNYDCDYDGIMIANDSFALYLEALDGMSYYQAANNINLLTSSLEENSEVTVNSHREYTASTGRKMLVFNATYSGMNVYIFITAASSSEVLIGQILKMGSNPSTSDLEVAAEVLSDSSIASRLPDNDEASEGIPEIDWNAILKASE